MSTFIDGIAAAQNIDSSGEIVSIDGLDISSLSRSGVFNWEHLKDHPGQTVGKILKAKKIFQESDCEDERQTYFWKKCQVPYVYVMGELFDDYKDSAKEVAGLFKYDAAKEGQQEVDVVGFSIEGHTLEKQGSFIAKSIAKKCTITTANCNKLALAKIVPPKKQRSTNIDELFKTENEFRGELVKSFFPKKAPAAPTLGSKLGQVGSHDVFTHAKPAHYGSATHKELKGIADIHHAAGQAAQNAGNKKVGDYHMNQNKWFTQAANRLEQRQRPQAQATRSAAPISPGKPNQVFHPQRSGKITPPSPIKKALDAGSGMAAPSQLSGGAALASESLEGKKKSKWLLRAEQEYKTWTKREEFEKFIAKRIPALTKSELKVLGQVVALNKSITLEKALSSMSGYESSLQKGGEDSIFTLILFDGCELHDILHCSHFATDAMTPDTYEKIEAVCDEYFEKDRPSEELEFNEAGVLGKHDQKVLFLTDGNPYKDLFHKLDAVVPYKYSKFRPHISVTTNVDEFKGKAASLVISVNGEVKKKYDFKSEDQIPGGLADKKKESDFDADKLKEGIKVEMEHTSDPEIAKEIAMDHLTEDPEYYQKLKTIEK